MGDIHKELEFEAYLEGAMSDLEKSAFEARLRAEPGLQESLDLHRNVQASLRRLPEREEINAKVTAMRQRLQPRAQSNRWRWSLKVAVVLIALGGLLVWLFFKYNRDTPLITSQINYAAAIAGLPILSKNTIPQEAWTLKNGRIIYKVVAHPVILSIFRNDKNVLECVFLGDSLAVCLPDSIVGNVLMGDSPAPTDLDLDGDPDLVSGLVEGEIAFFNDSGAGKAFTRITALQSGKSVKNYFQWNHSVFEIPATFSKSRALLKEIDNNELKAILLVR